MRRREFNYLIVVIVLLTTQRVLQDYSKILILALAIIAFLFFITHVITGCKNYDFNNIDRENRFIIFLLLLISLSIPIRSLIEIDNWSVSTAARLFVNSLAIMPYCLPLLALHAIYKVNLRLMVIISSVLAVLYVLVALTNISDLSQLRNLGLAHYQSYGGVSGYSAKSYYVYTFLSMFAAPQVVFLLKRYIPNKHWRLSCISIVSFFLVSLLLARRTSIFCTLLIFIASYYIIFKKNKKVVFFAVPCIIGCVAIFAYFGGFDFIISRFDSNTRESVEVAFYNDLDCNLLLFGRGALGTYYDPGFAHDGMTGHRDVIETGYLNHILKGGVFYLFVYVYVLLKSWYLGYYKSNNVLSKVFSVNALINCISLIPHGVPHFNLAYCFLWIGVGVCLNSKVRRMSDVEIQNYLWK